MFSKLGIVRNCKRVMCTQMTGTRTLFSDHGRLSSSRHTYKYRSAQICAFKAILASFFFFFIVQHVVYDLLSFNIGY